MVFIPDHPHDAILYLNGQLGTKRFIEGLDEAVPRTQDMPLASFDKHADDLN